MIVKKNQSCRIFEFTNTETLAPYAEHELTDAMIAKRFVPLADDVPVTFVFGFTAWDDPTVYDLAGDHNPAFTPYMAAGYRFDRKRVPASTVKMALAKRIKDFLTNWNQLNPDNQKKVLDKETRKNLLEATKADLEKTVPFTTKECGVFYDTENGLLLITGASEVEAEHIFRSLAASLENGPTLPQEMTLTDLAERYDKSYAEISDDLDKLLAAERMTVNELEAEFLTHLWFMSETMSKNGTLEMEGQPFRLWMSDANLTVGEILTDGKSSELLESKDTDHAYVRYAMWSGNRDVVKSKFDIEADKTPTTSITLSAPNPCVFGLTLPVPTNKELTRDNSSSYVTDYCDLMFATLRRVAALFANFATARVSPPRWEGTIKAHREWLEAYVPACEVEESKKLEKVEKADKK